MHAINKLDDGYSVFLWCGKKSESFSQKIDILSVITKYFKKEDRLQNIPITVIHEGVETKVSWFCCFWGKIHLLFTFDATI